MQKKKKKGKSRPPRYSADGMLIRMMGGTVLAGVGALAFVSVLLQLNGMPFDTLRMLTGGLGGALGLLFSALVTWGGILLIMASQRAVSVRRFLPATVLMMLLCAAFTLMSTSNGPLMDSIYKSYATDSFQTFITRGWTLGCRQQAGGAIGMLIAWPLWALFRSSLVASLIVVVLIIAGLIWGLPVNWKQLIGKVKAGAEKTMQQRRQQAELQRQQDAEWQRRQSVDPYPITDRNAAPVREPVPQGGRRAVTQNGDVQAVPVGSRVNPLSAQEQMEDPQDQRPYRRSIFGEEKRSKPAAKTERRGIFGFAQKNKDQYDVSQDDQEDPVLPRKPVIHPGEGMRAEEEPQTAAMKHEETMQPAANRYARPAVEVNEPDEAEEDDFVPVMAAAAPAGRRRRSRGGAAGSSSGGSVMAGTRTSAVASGFVEGTPEIESPLPPPQKEKPKENKPYVYPPLRLLREPKEPDGAADGEDALRSQKLQETLSSFRVPATVKHVTHGPAISRFEMEIAPGIRVNKINELDKNIAMNMQVKSVRIEAPIPGTSLVGVEVPNRSVTPVTLAEVLNTEIMRRQTSPLAVALGKDIAGQPIVCDLERMPHMLIAGATGSGKSVCINTIINSVIYRCSPQDVKMILVDPKVVELQVYNGIPHLLIPVVSDPHKASGALQWAVSEMMSRYSMFAGAQVRNIKGYNKLMKEQGNPTMPRILIIIDELADLMMTCKKDVEESICRLAQLARAAGMHLIVATQRPSVDVITGLIKANIPSRIAFKVSSFVDSRTILDRPGADKLLGYGDMLYLPNGEFTPIRVQGCFLSDEEVNSITDFMRENSSASYDESVIEQLEHMNEEDDGPDPADVIGGSGDDNGDDLLQRAVEMTVQDGQTSTSMLQRRLRVGYARAGRLVDEMEKRGIVSQKDGAKPRMCLITRDQYEQMKSAGQLKE